MTATALAAIRPNDWELPLFVHVLAALVLIGAIGLSAMYLLGTWRSGSAATLRLGLRSILIGILPSWIVLRGSSEWIVEKENLRDAELTWIDMGYMISDTGLLLILLAALTAWLALRRARAAGDGPSVSARFAAGFITVLLIANLVALWAMTNKPA